MDTEIFLADSAGTTVLFYVTLFKIFIIIVKFCFIAHNIVLLFLYWAVHLTAAMVDMLLAVTKMKCTVVNTALS